MLPSNTKIRVCYLPGRESGYARTRVLKAAMESAGMEVLDCSTPHRSGLRYFFSFCKFLKYHGQADVVLVGFLGHFYMPFVRLFTRKRIFLDILISIYQTLAFDRKAIASRGPLAGLAKFWDRTACRLADHVFCDTQQHIDYFVRTYGLSPEKFSRLWVGSDETVMYPRPGKEAGDFLVHFHGEFQALHGTEYIIEAAALCPDVKFRLIGEGRTRARCIQLAQDLQLKNVEFIPAVPYTKLPEYIAEASVCLGIFGDTQKTGLVIPHKAFEALAMGKPLITADTPSIRELLTDGKNVFLCAAANASSLAAVIRGLKAHPGILPDIGNAGRETFTRHCSPKVIGKDLLETLTLSTDGSS